jgi:hypothetical protein
MTRLSNGIALVALALIGLYPIWSYFLRVGFHVSYFPHLDLGLFMLWPLLLLTSGVVMLLVENRAYKRLGIVYLLATAYLVYVLLTTDF